MMGRLIPGNRLCKIDGYFVQFSLPRRWHLAGVKRALIGLS